LYHLPRGAGAGVIARAPPGRLVPVTSLAFLAAAAALAAAPPSASPLLGAAEPLTATAQAAPAASATTAATPAAPGRPFTLCFIGDVLPGVFYDEAINGGQDPFRNLRAFLTAGDLAIANLEGPMTKRGRRVVGKRFTFRVPPARAALLTGAGLDVVGLANNHIMDYGPTGLRDTHAALDAAGIRWCGASDNEVAARRPVIVEAGGVRVAFLAYNWTWPSSYQARAHSPGTAAARPSWVAADVAAARALAPVVVVLVHWGEEKSHALRDYQRPLARTVMEAGGSLLIGSHPHVPQGVERVGAGVAFYSLGDGVFGGARVRHEDSLAVRASFDGAGRLTGVECFALQSSNQDTAWAPRLRAGDDARPCLDLVRSLSGALGTTLLEGRSGDGLPSLSVSLNP